jgi:hypothetical protein
MTAYSIRRVIDQGSRKHIYTSNELSASTDELLVFVRNPTELDRESLRRMGLGLVETDDEALFIVVKAEQEGAVLWK